MSTELKPLQQVLIEELGKQPIERTPVPATIANNLKPQFTTRPYQERAFKLFTNYWEQTFEGKPRANHQLLFHMATGSGKTLIMAGLITYLYSQGYRNFLFFVNSVNVIQFYIFQETGDLSISSTALRFSCTTCKGAVK